MEEREIGEEKSENEKKKKVYMNRYIKNSSPRNIPLIFFAPIPTKRQFEFGRKLYRLEREGGGGDMHNFPIYISISP